MCAVVPHVSMKMLATGADKEHSERERHPCLQADRGLWRPACIQATAVQDAKCSGRPEDSKPGSLQIANKVLEEDISNLETWRDQKEAVR